MSIYTLQDLRATAPAHLRNVSDYALINEYAKSNGMDPVQVAQYFGLGQQGGMASNRIGAGIDNYQANMYGLVGAGARALGANQVAGWADRNREANELQADIATLRARDLGAVDDWRDVRGVGSGLNYVGGLAAQSLPYLAEAAVGGLAARGVMTGTRAALAAAQTPQAAAAARRALNIGSMVGAVGASYPSAVGDVLASQREEAGVENLGSAALGGVPYAAMNAIGAEGLVARGVRPLGSITEGRLMRRVGEQAGKTALTEGVAETGQEMVNQYFGRMAVNPEQTMFNEGANRRYLDAFIGGAALGGAFGGAAGVRRPIDESFNYDLTQRDTMPPASPTGTQAGPTARLGYSPLAGTPIVFPDGTVALNGEQELQARYGTPPTPAAAPSAPTNQTQAAVDENADLDALILDRTSLKPNNKMRTFAKRIVGLDLETVDPDTEVAVWNALAERKYGAAEKLLKAFEESAAANDRQNVVAPAGAPATQPGTGDIPALPTAATPDAAVAAVSQPPTARAGQPAGAAQNTADQGAVNRVVSSGGSTAASLPTSASAGVGVSSTQTDGTQTAQAQQAAPQGSAAASIRPTAGQPVAGAPSAPVEAAGVTQPQTESAAWDEYRDDAQPAWDQLPDNQKQIWRDALAVRRRGQPINLYKVAEELGGTTRDPRLDTLQKIFGERDGEIIFDVVGSGMSEAAAAKKWGMSRSNVQKIAGATGRKVWPEKIRAAMDKYGLTEAQIAAAFSRTASEADAARSEVESEIMPTVNMFGARGIDPLMAKEAGMEGIVNTAGGSTSQVVGISKQAKEFDRALETLAAADRGELELAADTIEALRATVQAEIARIQEVEAKARELVRLTAGKRSTKDKNEAAEAAGTKRKAGKAMSGDITDVADDAVTQGTEVDLRSDAERAAEAWDKVAMELDGAPLFDELTQDQQETFVEYGEGNWTRQDVLTELAKIDRQREEAARDGAEFGETDSPTDAYTAKELEADLKAFMRVDALGRNVIIVDKPTDLEDIRDVVTGLTNIRAFGWTRDGTAVLIASRIQKGMGRAKFMHEVGLHLGMQRMLPPEVFNRLVDQVIEWAARSDNRLETRLAKKALVRVPEDTAPASVRNEIVAYFVEEAVMAGVDPTATNQLQSPVLKWFRSLMGAFKRALVKLGVKPESLRAKDYVNLAYGAASLALDTMPSGSSEVEFGMNPPKAPTRSAIERNVASLPKPMQGPVRNTLLGVGDVVRKVLDRVVFTNVLIDRAVNAGIKSADRFSRLLAERAAKARELEREVEKIADMYADVEEKDKGDGARSLNRFLFESTRQGKWGYGDKADPEMKAWFDSLGKNSQKLAKAIFAHGDKILAQKKQAVIDYTNTEYDALIEAAQEKLNAATTADERKDAKENLAELKREKADSLKKYETLFKLREGSPYAPIKRMGNYVVVAKSSEYRAAEEAGDTKKLDELAKDGDHYHVSFTDTKNEARRLADNLREQGFYGRDNEAVYFMERSTTDEELFGGDSMLQALTKLRARVDGTDNKGRAALQRMVTELWLNALAENSARKSEMRRKGVDGEVDMLRSFAAQGRADAQFIASVQYNAATQESIQSMRKEVKRGGDRLRKSEIMNELMERYATSLDVVHNPVVDKITRMSSVYFLASSPMYFLQNLTQPWMMSVPAMAKNHDYTKVSSELFKAYSELGPVMRSGKLFETGFDFDQVPADVKEAIKTLVNRGRIDIGLDTELGEFRIDGQGAFADGWNKVDKGLRLLVQKGEAINRLSTAIAAYRLELGRTNSVEAALDYTDKILLDTHGDYGRFNAPKYFNTSLGRIALQFRKFQLIQLTWYAKLIKDAFTNPAERKAALKGLGFALGHTALLAGVMGLPGYAAIAWALGQALGDDDEKFDLTYELRRFIGDETMANLIMRGTPTLAGADISGKVGAGTMLSIMPFSNADLSTPEGKFQAAGTLIGGASLGMGARIADGLGLMLSGDWVRGAELVLPKGLGDAIRGAREASDGVTRRNGDVILPPEEVSAVEAVMQAIGMPPVQTTVTNERRSRAFEMDKHFRERTTRIKNDYAKAARRGDTEGMRQARDAWMRLQDARVKAGYTRQPMSNLLKAPQEQAKRERDTAGGVQFNRSNAAFAREQASF